MRAVHDSKFLGVVGGVGPLASAEFVKTIYEHSLGAREQTAPRVLLYSDPTFPDRTEELLAGRCEPLLESLTVALGKLFDAGASRAVVCCVTMHYLLPRLPAEWRSRIVSLVEVALGQVAAAGRRQLLLCSTGTRRLETFENHPLWGAARQFVVRPDEADQAAVHETIYRIKRNHDLRLLAPFVESLLDKYGVGSFVSGCTEIHLLAKYFQSRGGRPSSTDPLTIIAQRLSEEVI